VLAILSQPSFCLAFQVSSPLKTTPNSLSEYEVLPNGCEAHWEVVERILFIYAKLNPGIAYVQGMNEIVGPLYYTFATDPNSEWKGERLFGCSVMAVILHVLCVKHCFGNETLFKQLCFDCLRPKSKYSKR